MYENKRADQLHGYLAAFLHLLFYIYLPLYMSGPGETGPRAGP